MNCDDGNGMTGVLILLFCVGSSSRSNNVEYLGDTVGIVATTQLLIRR